MRNNFSKFFNPQISLDLAIVGAFLFFLVSYTPLKQASMDVSGGATARFTSFDLFTPDSNTTEAFYGLSVHSG